MMTPTLLFIQCPGGGRRRAFSLALAICLGTFGLSPDLGAAVLIKMVPEHTTTLQYEQIQVVLTIINEEDVTLAVTPDGQADEPYVTFDVERSNGQPVRRRKEGQIVDKLTIKPDGSEDVMVDLTRWYELHQEGRYLVSAVVIWNGKRYTSERIMFEVVRGLEVAQDTRSIRGYPDRQRTYSLRYWTREKREYLFLVVEEDMGRVSYGTFMLGPLIRYYKPGLKVERNGDVLVYHQSGPNRYTKSVFKAGPHSVEFIDQNYFDEEGQPYGKPRSEDDVEEDSQKPEQTGVEPSKPAKSRGWRFWK